MACCRPLTHDRPSDRAHVGSTCLRGLRLVCWRGPVPICANCGPLKLYPPIGRELHGKGQHGFILRLKRLHFVRTQTGPRHVEHVDPVPRGNA